MDGILEQTPPLNKYHRYEEPDITTLFRLLHLIRNTGITIIRQPVNPAIQSAVTARRFSRDTCAGCPPGQQAQSAI